uniref:hypothetical protein n=1 Tax=Candidatus Nitrotoga sp. 1052 TaxID=2886964 RepID=UPI001EF6B368|nr:hypothetical protein [Candidatus Nitrotoga sp. 1052]
MTPISPAPGCHANAQQYQQRRGGLGYQVGRGICRHKKAGIGGAALILTARATTAVNASEEITCARQIRVGLRHPAKPAGAEQARAEHQRIVPRPQGDRKRDSHITAPVTRHKGRRRQRIADQIQGIKTR